MIALTHSIVAISMTVELAPQVEAGAPTVKINQLQYAYPGCAPFIQNMSLELPKGARCLLLGANGAGELALIKRYHLYVIRPRIGIVTSRLRVGRLMCMACG